ncbi:unnamed protein product [Hyaloperonospora brassicae]|uniref:PhoD-like phosphatase metallophosphatase domain-containing protein n=1 Tax=Hyaloperonospora brassicae TaxID=162125 RepID=A0AAV0TCW4_HYABA|nr:unnamed protein product [Hyaloperonospora brassicae]
MASPGRRQYEAVTSLDSQAVTSLSAANIQPMASQAGIEQLLSLAHLHVDNVMAARHIEDKHDASLDDGGCAVMASRKTKTRSAATLPRSVLDAVRKLHRNVRGKVGGSGAVATLTTAEVGEARYERLKAGFSRLQEHLHSVAEHRDQLLCGLDQLHSSTTCLQEVFMDLIKSPASPFPELSSSLSVSCAAIEKLKNVLEHKVAKQTRRKLAELELFAAKLDEREQLRQEVDMAERQLQISRVDNLKRGPYASTKRTATAHDIAVERQAFQQLRRRLTVMTEALEHVFQFHVQLDQCIAEPELETVRKCIVAQRSIANMQQQLRRVLAALCVLSSACRVSPTAASSTTDGACHATDVLWLWSGALTSRSITFKCGVREGYTCAPADFVLYAFPALRDGEKPHSAIATCSTVDGGEAGAGEERSASADEPSRVVQCTLSALPHRDREYRYELTLLESGAVVKSGRFRTPKAEGTAYDYRVAFASCADERSDPRVFEAIGHEDALLFVHTGDLHYHNLIVNDVAAFRDGYDSIFASPAGQAMLAMDVPFAYMWDDHDFGPDNSDATAPGRNASVQAYREAVPHYPLVGGRSRTSTVHQAFTIGRVRYLLTDLRSARTPNTAPAAPTKTVLGKQQKAWFKSELVRATNDPSIRLIVWVNTMPWLDDERKWGQFVHEQQELVNYIKAHGLNKWVPIVIVSGDAHMLAVDDGRHSPGNLTVLHAAALGRPGSIKGGPYSHGAFAGSGQYAVMDITDEGGEHGRVCIHYRGMNIDRGMLIEYDTCHPERTPPVAPYYPPPIPVRILMRVWKKAKRYGGIAAVVIAIGIALFVLRSRRQRALRARKYS